jgi:hypothetical protein
MVAGPLAPVTGTTFPVGGVVAIAGGVVATGAIVAVEPVTGTKVAVEPVTGAKVAVEPVIGPSGVEVVLRPGTEEAVPTGTTVDVAVPQAETTSATKKSADNPNLYFITFLLDM